MWPCAVPVKNSLHGGADLASAVVFEQSLDRLRIKGLAHALQQAVCRPSRKKRSRRVSLQHLHRSKAQALSSDSANASTRLRKMYLPCTRLSPRNGAWDSSLREVRQSSDHGAKQWCLGFGFRGC